MKPYLFISGMIFGLVAVVHLLRLVNHWPLVLGSWSAPMSMSVVGLMIGGCLSIWAFRLMRKE